MESAHSPNLKLSYAADRWFRIAPANQWIMSMDMLKRGALVVLLCRISNRERRSHLKRQEQRLRTYCAERGLVVVDVIYEVRSASHGWNCDRQKLEKAALVAQEHNATLVALSVDRFIRGPLLKNKAPMLPSASDFHRLQMLTNNVTLATLIHPDTAPEIVRSIYTKMGFAAQSKPGDLKHRKEELKPEAGELHQDGLSLRQIVSWINAATPCRPVSLKTIFTWVKSV